MFARYIIETLCFCFVLFCFFCFFKTFILKGLQEFVLTRVSKLTWFITVKKKPNKQTKTKNTHTHTHTHTSDDSGECQ